MMMIITTETC